MSIRNIIRKMVYGPKADSDSYIKYLKEKGYKIGDDCKIYVPSKTSIDEPCYMLDIGNRVRITEGVTILCHDASVYTLDYAGRQYKSAPRVFKKTTIGNNVFIGRYAIVLMGSHIGDNVIIGAGSVVHGVIESDSVYAGNPARKICTLKEFNEKCAVGYVASAKEYAQELTNHLERCPKIEEMYLGYKHLFEDGNQYPTFHSVEELIEYEEDRV